MSIRKSRSRNRSKGRSSSRSINRNMLSCQPTSPRPPALCKINIIIQSRQLDLDSRPRTQIENSRVQIENSRVQIEFSRVQIEISQVQIENISIPDVTNPGPSSPKIEDMVVHWLDFRLTEKFSTLVKYFKN